MKHQAQEIARPVPLNGWTVTPSIDFVTFTNLPEARMHRLVRELKKASLAPSTVKVAHEGTRRLLTVHDPAIAQLQLMIDSCPNAHVYEVEFTVDFRPAGDEPAGLDELAPVFSWFADTLYPAMVNAKRLRYEAGADDKGRYAPTPHGPSNTLMTHIWRDGLERVKNRLYIKELDQGQSVQRPSVRLETRLGMTACGDMGLGRAWQFGEFGVNLRRVLSPYFYIADSIKPKFKRMRHKEGTRIAQETAKANQREIDKVTNGWRTQGAMWAVKHGYAVVPNKQAHKRIGDALHRLGRQLTALKPSEKSRAPDRWIPAESLEFLDVPD